MQGLSSCPRLPHRRIPFRYTEKAMPAMLYKSPRQTLMIDADDTLWENNIYFERAIAEFISFLNHHQYTFRSWATDCIALPPRWWPPSNTSAWNP